MLIHLTPRYYAKYSDVQVDVIDVEVPELKLLLKANEDIIIRTPFPNKNYKVASRKKGRKAINGIFIETEGMLQNFTVITRWAVNGEISRHETFYHISDDKFDAVTEEDFLWNGFNNTPYRSRSKEDTTLIKRQSSMVTLISDLNSNDGDSNWTYNETDNCGIVRYRAEFIKLPTVERARLTVPFFGNKRLPAYDDAFIAQVYTYGFTVVPGKLKEFGVYVVPLHDWLNEINEECEGDLLFQIISEIKDKASFFFSNSNHLECLAKAYSQTYNELDMRSAEYINGCLNQPVFHVFISDIGDTNNSEM